MHCHCHCFFRPALVQVCRGHSLIDGRSETGDCTVCHRVCFGQGSAVYLLPRRCRMRKLSPATIAGGVSSLYQPAQSHIRILLSLPSRVFRSLISTYWTLPTYGGCMCADWIALTRPVHTVHAPPALPCCALCSIRTGQLYVNWFCRCQRGR